MQGRTQRKHEKLEVWQDSMALVVLVYRLIATLPTTEKFGLVLQMQRASVSISLNIAEGAARGTTKDYVRFLVMARGSLVELETPLNIVQRLGFVLSSKEIFEQCNNVFGKLSGLIESLKIKLNEQNGYISRHPSLISQRHRCQLPAPKRVGL